MIAAVLRVCLIAAIIGLYECHTCRKCLWVAGTQPNASVPVHHPDCEVDPEKVPQETCEGSDTCATTFFEAVVTVHNEAENITTTADIDILSRSCSMFPKPAVLPDTECGYAFNTSVATQAVTERVEARNLTLINIKIKNPTRCQCYTDNCNIHKISLNSATTHQGALLGFILSSMLFCALY